MRHRFERITVERTMYRIDSGKAAENDVLCFFSVPMFGGIVGVVAMCIFSLTGRDPSLKARECREA
jgi:hypothetical protein